MATLYHTCTQNITNRLTGEVIVVIIKVVVVVVIVVIVIVRIRIIAVIYTGSVFGYVVPVGAPFQGSAVPAAHFGTSRS